MSKVNVITPSNLASFNLFPRGTQVFIWNNEGVTVNFGTVVGHEVDDKGNIMITVTSPQIHFTPFSGRGNGEVTEHYYPNQLGFSAA